MPSPIVVTNPEVIKYLICQLWTEAILLLTLFLLIPSIVWEEWLHFIKKRLRKKGRKEKHDDAIKAVKELVEEEQCKLSYNAKHKAVKIE